MLKFYSQFSPHQYFFQDLFLDAENTPVTKLKEPLTAPEDFGMFSNQNKKPELAGSGPGTDVIGLYVPPIIADSDLRASDKICLQNALLCAEKAMTYDAGYIRLPRSLLTDPRFRDIAPAWQVVFLTMIRLAVWKKTEFNDHGKIITLEPGQLCYPIRRLAIECGKKTSRNQVERAIVYFCFYDFSRQDAGHRTSILTITHKDTYDLLLKTSETTCETRARQERDINEEYKEVKDIKKKKVAANDSADRSRPTAASINFSFEFRKWENIQPADLEGWKQAYPAVDIEAELLRMAEWLLANPANRKNNYRAFIVRWLTKAQDAGMPRLNGAKYSRRSGREINADKAAENDVFERKYL